MSKDYFRVDERGRAAMTDTPEDRENAPIATSTRVPLDSSDEEPEPDVDSDPAPIATSTRVHNSD